MSSQILSQMKDIKGIFFSLLFTLLYLFISCLSLEASLIAPDLYPTLPGYEEFVKGRSCFEEEKWEEAILFFAQAINNSDEPYFECSAYWSTRTDVWDRNACDSYNEERDFTYIISKSEIGLEISFAIYRHSHYYLGLIRLYQEEFTIANLHFKKAIGFGGYEDEEDTQFYNCVNYIHPSWIALASLTRLQVGKGKEAQHLMDLAFRINGNLDHLLEWDSTTSLRKKYSIDFIEKGFTSEKWHDIQHILLLNTTSIIAHARNDLKEAIYLISLAIRRKDYAIKNGIFPSESKDSYMLYSNRGLLYSQNGNYHEALADLTKAIELNPDDADLYVHRAEFELILEDYPKAFDDYHRAIKRDPNNPEYYRQRALAYAIIGSMDEVRSDLELAEFKENQVNTVQNELGITEFSTGSFQKAIAHFSQFIALNPLSAIGYQNRGAALYEAGKIKEAIENYDQAISCDPKRADLYQMRAVALMALPAADEIEENANLMEAQSNQLTALELNPADAKIYQNLGALYSLQEDRSSAIHCYEKALILAPQKDHSKILKNLSRLYFEQADYEKALLHCEKAIAAGCNDEAIHLLQGLCFFETNQFEQAIRSYDLALKSGSNDPNVYFNRAKAHFCLHQLSDALEDATRVLNAEKSHVECYKLRGLIFLSMHKELEAYSDFRMAMQVGGWDDSGGPDQSSKNNSKFTSNSKGTLFQFDDLVTSLDGRMIYKPLFASKHVPNNQSIAGKLGQIQIDAFGKGLIFGLGEGGIETVKELGPFFANLLFHPYETTKELLAAIQHLLQKALEEEWEAVFEALAPELKELFSTWDKIEDYHKGKLTGLFIGKNGVAALTAIGAVKTFSKLKSVVIGSPQKFSRCLKRTKPEVVPLPIAELPVPSSVGVGVDKGWHLPYHGGAVIGGRFYTEHALGRMAPKKCIQSRAILEDRAFAKTKELGLPIKNFDELVEWTKTEGGKSFSIQPRGIPPSVIEAEIANSGSGRKIEVILDEKKITVVQPYKISKIIVRNKNTKIHIMQPEHAWDKLIKLTGNIEEDCKNVIKLLEDNQVFLEKYRVKPVEVFDKIVRYNHQMKINGYEVKVIFNVNLETSEMYLNDAWVITK